MVNAHIVQTRKELDEQSQEVITSSKVMLPIISEHRSETESTVSNQRKEINQNREQVDNRLHAFSGKVRSSIQEWESRVQSVKQTNDSEIMRMNEAISSLEAKITAVVTSNNSTAIQPTVGFGATAVRQTESTVVTVKSNTSVNSVSGENASNLSTFSGSADVPNTSVNSCNNNANAGSELYANNTDLSEMTLLTFKDSTSQVPLHFFRDLDLYFSLKRTPEELRLVLVFRAVKEPLSKQCLSSVFDRMKNYDEFKEDPGSGESCLDHYIRYANMASTLNPPMSDLDLLSALTSHFEPRVQQGLICSNLQSTQDALAFLAKLQGLGNHRQTFGSPRRDFNHRDTNRGLPQDQDNVTNRDRGNGSNVLYVRQGDRQNRGFYDRKQQGEGGGSFHLRGQGNMRENRSSQLNPIAPNFHPRDYEPQRSQDSRLSAETTDDSPPTLNH